VLLATTATIWLTHFEPAGFTQLLSNGLGSNDDSEVDAKVIDDRLCFVRKLVKLLTVYEAKSKTTVGQQLLYSVFGRLTKDGAVPEDRKVRFAFDAIEAHLPTVIAAMPEKPSSTNSTCAGAKISA
jgi:hypothetical protein